MLEWGNLDKPFEGAISPQTPQQAPPSQSPQSSQQQQQSSQQQQQQQLFQSDMALVSPTSALSPDLHSGIRRANSAGGGFAGGGFAGGGAARHWPSSGAHDTPQRGRSERSLRSEKVRKRLKARLEAKLEAELEAELEIRHYPRD